MHKLPDDIANRALVVAYGVRAKDMNFVNRTLSVEDFVNSLMTFERGVKDGACILSGAVVPAPSGARGTDRKAHNMTANYVVMIDFDQGDTPEEVQQKARDLGLMAVVWTTHSHWKQIYPVPEKAVIDWLRKNGTHSDAPDNAEVNVFFRENIKIYPKYMDNLEVLGKQIIIGGMHFMCKMNQPLPKCRALFFLDKKFDFAARGGTQAQAMDEWKERYAGFAEKTLGMTSWDHACMDPSRLMYLPRIAADADITQHSSIYVPGKFLDFENVERVVRGKAALRKVAPGLVNFANNANMTGTSGEKAPAVGADLAQLKTPWLMTFIKQHGHDFEAADWMVSITPLDSIPQCPWASLHTPNADGAEDAGFKAWNASSQGETGFNMQCSHNGCKSDVARGMRADGKQDRMKYLDALIVENNTTQDELLEFCPHAAEEHEAAMAAQAEAKKIVEAIDAASADKDKIAADVAAITETTPSNEKTRLLHLIASVSKAEGLWIDDQVAMFCKLTGKGKTVVNETLDALRREIAAARTLAAAAAPGGNAGIFAGRNPPEEPEDATVICHEWHHDNQVECALARFHKVNEAKPQVFCFNDGPLVRVDDVEGRATQKDMTEGMWAPTLRKAMRFSKILPNPDGTVSARGIAPFPDVVHDIATGGEVRGLPLLRIGRIPVFGPDGRLRTERGYDRDLKVWLDPEIVCLPVSAKPGVEEVEEARWWLSEAICDFPFSDAMDGKETLPVKVGPADERGYRETNFARGISSRTNMIAAILLPFVRAMIDGPCPAYHIDKPIAGTGAGYMADCISIINEGQRAAAQPMSANNEEFRKSITATLRDGAGIIFIDNLSRKVDSGELAAALTAGNWRDRILGKSETVTIKMLAMWLFAGNNAPFTPELMRRNIPIRIDAAVENATQDRGQECFKYFPYQPWLINHRPKLVWSCHTVIQHWLACGRPRGAATFHSFDAYADVMSGILYQAGFDGFLANIPDYLALKNEDSGVAKEWAQLIFEKFGLDNRMKLEDMLSVVKGGIMGRDNQVDLPIKTTGWGNDTTWDLKDGHAYVAANMKSPFNLEWGKDTPGHRDPGTGARPVTGWPIKVSLVLTREKRPKKYAFFAVPE
jgi:hypothetical protein